MDKNLDELLDKALNNDSEAYGEIIKMILPELYYIAMLKLKNKEDVSEAVQETLVNSFQYLKTLEDKKKFKIWIIRILNTACNRIYINRNKNMNLFSKIIHNTYLNKEDNSIEEFESNENFKNMLNVLNGNEREIITLYYKYGYSTGHIAYILRKSKNTVKSQLLRAKKKLEKYVKEDKYDESRK